MSIREQTRAHAETQTTRIVLTRWLLQLAFCLTACVHIPRALNHRLHRFRSLYACSGSLITNKTSEFPPKCITRCKQNNTQRHFNENTSQCGITDKTGHFWAWDEQGTFEGLFSDMGPCEQKHSQYLHKCINTYVGIGQLDAVSKLCFSESEAFEKKQLANK